MTTTPLEGDQPQVPPPPPPLSTLSSSHVPEFPRLSPGFMPPKRPVSLGTTVPEGVAGPIVLSDDEGEEQVRDVHESYWGAGIDVFRKPRRLDFVLRLGEQTGLAAVEYDVTVPPGAARTWVVDDEHNGTLTAIYAHPGGVIEHADLRRFTVLGDGEEVLVPPTKDRSWVNRRQALTAMPSELAQLVVAGRRGQPVQADDEHLPGERIRPDEFELAPTDVLVVLTGHPNSGKTMLSAWASLRVARAGKIAVVVNCESRYDVQERWHAMGITPQERSRIEVVTAPPLTSRGDRRELTEFIRQRSPRLVVLDSLPAALEEAAISERNRRHVHGFVTDLFGRFVTPWSSVLLADLPARASDRKDALTGHVEAKADLTWGLHPVETFTPQRSGLVRLHVGKDRFGLFGTGTEFHLAVAVGDGPLRVEQAGAPPTLREVIGALGGAAGVLLAIFLAWYGGHQVRKERRLTHEIDLLRDLAVRTADIPGAAMVVRMRALLLILNDPAACPVLRVFADANPTPEDRAAYRDVMDRAPALVRSIGIDLDDPNFLNNYLRLAIQDVCLAEIEAAISARLHQRRQVTSDRGV